MWRLLPLSVMQSVQHRGQPLRIHACLLNPGEGCLGRPNRVSLLDLMLPMGQGYMPGDSLHQQHAAPALTWQPPACSFDPASGASAEANNCAVAALAGLSQEDLLMAEWNNSIGRPCHYVCVDRAHHCLVLSIRWAAAPTELHLASTGLCEAASAVLEVCNYNQVSSRCGSGKASTGLQMSAADCFSYAGSTQQGSSSVRASIGPQMGALAVLGGQQCHGLLCQHMAASILQHSPPAQLAGLLNLLADGSGQQPQVADVGSP